MDGIKLIISLWFLLLRIEDCMSSLSVDLSPSSDVTAVKFKFVYLSCKVESSSVYNVTWRRNNVILTKKPPPFIIEWEKGGVLMVRPLFLTFSGYYECEVQNGIDLPVKKGIRINVKEDTDIPSGFPQLVKSSIRPYVTEFETLLLTCEFAGNPKPSLTWFFRRVPVDLSDSRITASGFTLEIKNVSLKEQGFFECQGLNNHGVSYGPEIHTFVKKYIPPTLPPIYPQIIDWPKNLIVRPETDVGLKCNATGLPEPVFRWYRQGRLLGGSKDGIYVINYIIHSDNFTCQALNQVGSAFRNFTVTVLPIPLRPRNPEFVSRTPHSITFEWEDSVIEEYEIKRYIIKYRKLGATNWSQVILPFSNNKTYTHDNLKIFQFYQFQIISANDVGQSLPSAIKTFHSGETVPSTPARNQLAWGLSDTTANVTWLQPEITNGRVAGYRIFYTRDKTLPLKYWYKAATSFLTVRLRLLQRRAVYYYKIQVFSSRGDGPFSNVSVFKAQRGAPGQIGVSRVASTTSSSIGIEWDAPEYKGDGLDGYEIAFNRSGNKEGSLEIDTVTEKGVVKNLRPYTFYNIRVAARSFAGLGPYSEPMIVQTKEDIPSAPPKNVRGFPKSSTSLEVLWEAPPLEHQNGPLVSYQIFYTQSDTAVPSIEVVNATNDKVLLKELNKYTKYTIWVVAVNSLGSGPPSSKFEIYTDEDVPEGAPRQVRVAALNSTAFSVSWLEPIEKSGRIRGFVVYYLPVTDDRKIIPLKRTIRRHVVEGEKIKFTIVNAYVEQLTTYRVQVAAYTVVGEGSRSPYIYVKTPKRRPPPPRITIITPDETLSNILIKWRPRIAGVVEYKVVFGKSLRQYDSLTDVQTNKFPATIRQEVFGNLSYGVWYNFRISASTVDGSSAESSHWVLTPDGVPTGWPERVEAATESSSSIKVLWKRPDPWKESGLIVKYRIQYKKQGDLYRYVIYDGTSANVMEKLIGSLQSSTEYIVGVQAFTTAGPGPFSQSVKVKTNDEVLPVVEALQVSEVTSTTAFVRWKQPPLRQHIQLQMYRLTYRGSKSYTDENGVLQTMVSQESKEIRSTSYQLTELHPALRYQVEIFLITTAGIGEGELVSFTTDNHAPPSIPLLDVNSMPSNRKVVSINVKPASQINGPVEYYLLFVVNLGTDETIIEDLLEKSTADYTITAKGRRNAAPNVHAYVARQFLSSELPNSFQIGDGKSYNQYKNSELDPGSYYTFFLRAFVPQSNNQKGYATVSGGYSKVFFYSPNGLIPLGQQQSKPGTGSASNMAWVAALVAGLIIIVILILLFVVYRRRRRAKRYLDREERKPLRHDSGKGKPRDLVELHRMTFQTPGIMNHPPVSLASFERHCMQLKENENLKFVQEFESIDVGRTFASEASVQIFNKCKNRYPNVLAYDHTRVKLPFTGELGSDYINANYIDGYCRERAYIATQGPMLNTVDDFWRACWEENTASIVMMTELEERGRGKCAQYWPSSGSQSFGDIKVGLKESLELCYFTIRTLEVAMVDSNEVREMKHFQFTAWPEIGVPLDEGPLLAYIRCIKSYNPPTAGPIMVHCSAGVGRTACFIVIHSMLERIAHDNTVDIYGYVTMLRSQRNFTMQSEEQYVFVHDALLEAIHSNTEIQPNQLVHHFRRLVDLNNKSTDGQLLDDEFTEVVKRSIPDPCNCLTAQITGNLNKNRCETVIPYDSNRVCLEQLLSQETSDYINASYIDGYRSRHAYIAAQGPMKSTANDFWRMIVEQSCSVVVMLTKLEERGKEHCFKYWPSDKTVHYHFYVIEPVSEVRHEHFVVREFKVKDARDGSMNTVRQFHYLNWPKGGAPLSSSGVIELIGQVQEAQNQLCSGGPIIVHSNTGSGRTGVFIALSIALERLRVENKVDLCQMVKSLRRQRPFMVQTIEQYQFCYQALVDFLRSFDYVV